jgi:putative ABC transport system substrate-binding protein
VCPLLTKADIPVLMIWGPYATRWSGFSVIGFNWLLAWSLAGGGTCGGASLSRLWAARRHGRSRRVHSSPKRPRGFVSLRLIQVRWRRLDLGHSLRDLGYVDGQTITIDYLSANGQGERFPDLAADCVRLKADVIVVTTTPAAKAAKAATGLTPIVMYPLGDPVVTGLVASLNRPGGNVTGLTFMASGIAAKRLELLKEVVPKISRVLVLSYRPISGPQLEELESAAASLGVKLLTQDIRSAEDIPAKFDAGVREGVEGVLTTAESIFAAQGRRVAELALEHKLPGMYPYRLMVDAGGLMAFDSYTSSFQARTATYVDEILKGANPSDLPIERPTKFELIINMRTAKTLGLAIPSSLTVRADEVIE